MGPHLPPPSRAELETVRAALEALMADVGRALAAHHAAHAGDWRDCAEPVCAALRAALVRASAALDD